jgi:hypothetical protein
MPDNQGGWTRGNDRDSATSSKRMSWLTEEAK